VVEPLENVARHVGAVAPGEVDVKVGRILAVEVDKPLEVEVKLDGIYVSNAENVGHHAVGAAPPPHVKITLSARVGSDVPVDQKVRDKLLLGDDFQLLFESVENYLVGIGIAII